MQTEVQTRCRLAAGCTTPTPFPAFPLSLRPCLPPSFASPMLAKDLSGTISVFACGQPGNILNFLFFFERPSPSPKTMLDCMYWKRGTRKKKKLIRSPPTLFWGEGWVGKERPKKEAKFVAEWIKKRKLSLLPGEFISDNLSKYTNL